ncbi:Bug family tripartite tricarboxylate transporter substrate binding protein [Paracidovorax valerianellae]|uniref:Tripartite-type tricarboxylate transporter, receptor component TctC n=1 Tax=Paracidovorax valerianellae TaxID=187868 RepID=A0A1G6UT33_9BURK|nr:tripartite tricarboxylate transporter substrate binding protein [Paracidovorax valerianellae]MDA8446889.1 tripartite tricarboxylate transporter substrate binding protein [Paracidovorax valerianellae]SDD44453.1 Tripartite-type tricarboxylate transporter, receptor component TctC [Paracidovorax valerianellae]
MKRFLAALSLGVLAIGAHAQAWPEKPVTLVVPFPPGGSTDQVARAVGPRLTEKFKQSFLVDNRPGATGTIGATYVQRAAPDGYTFLVTSLGPLVIVPHLLKGLQYDAMNGFDLITVAVQSPNVLVVPASSPHKTVADVIAYEKANPGKMSFASAGNGSSDHLTAELFWQQTGTKGVHIPYKGGAPAHTDLIGGQVDASFQNINAVAQYIKAGKMRALAITSPKRSPVLPDVPTLAEAGVPNVEVASWQAIVAPKGLPPALREKAHAAFVEALKDPKVREQFTSIGFEMVTNTPEQFTAFQQQESARWKKVIEIGKISID